MGTEPTTEIYPSSSGCSPPPLPVGQSGMEPPEIPPPPAWCSTPSTNAGRRKGWEAWHCRETGLPLSSSTASEFSLLEEEWMLSTRGAASFWLQGECSGKRVRL